MTNNAFLFFMIFFINANSYANNNIPTLFPTNNIKIGVPYHPTTKWIVIFIHDPSISVITIDKEGISSSQYLKEKGICLGSRIVLTGGYFKNDDKGKRPVGLHVNKGIKTSGIEPWKYGGYIYQTQLGKVNFAPLKSTLPEGVTEALQSKPFVVEQGRVAVYYDKKDSEWDRIAIGSAIYNNRTGLVIFAAISDLSKRKAVRLENFAKAVKLLSNFLNIEVKDVLNLDGAEGPFVWLKAQNKYFGSSGKRYISSVLCIN